jgi:hypothetical protein
MLQDDDYGDDDDDVIMMMMSMLKKAIQQNCFKQKNWKKNKSKTTKTTT